ncbi:hypothetical protein CEXT_324121 [Caerostris extrusa]|uniref:Uncharacterized protein n=1 Tax=Caerostris extrusa TaxID=172846 RepID=A0AAV4XQ43_CAEEX|nr:hypothetical protein CEXT_324121 [Caerostris extrusa]
MPPGLIECPNVTPMSPEKRDPPSKEQHAALKARSKRFCRLPLEMPCRRLFPTESRDEAVVSRKGLGVSGHHVLAKRTPAVIFSKRICEWQFWIYPLSVSRA